jgi:hypothetical protein
MSVGNSGNTAFPHIADRKPTGPDTARTLDRLDRKLRRAGAYGAADRLEAIDEKIWNGELSFDGLERHIDPDRVVDELNSARGRVRWAELVRGEWRLGLRPIGGFFKSVRYAHLSRNICALAPLIFTWIMLGLAAQHYNRYLNVNPRAANEPFLLLWQQGFGSGFPSFEHVAFIDFGLLTLVVLLTYWVHWTEWQAERVGDLVYQAMDSLEEFTAKSGIISNPITSANLAAEVTAGLSKALWDLGKLNDASEKAIKEATDRLEGIQGYGQELVKNLHDQTEKIIANFGEAVLQTLKSVTEQNEHFISNTRETNQQVLQALVEQQMQPLLQQEREMLGQFQRQQEAFTTAVTDLSKGVKTINTSAQGLADSAVTFTGSTQSIGQSLAGMAKVQEQFASSVGASAKSMNDAASALTGLRDAFRDELHKGLEQMTVNITGASDSLRETQAGLERTTNAMGSGAEAFNRAMGSGAETFKSATDESAKAFAQISQAWDNTLRETKSTLEQALGVSSPGKRRRWWQLRRRS